MSNNHDDHVVKPLKSLLLGIQDKNKWFEEIRTMIVTGENDLNTNFENVQNKLAEKIDDVINELTSNLKCTFLSLKLDMYRVINRVLQPIRRKYTEARTEIEEMLEYTKKPSTEEALYKAWNSETSKGLSKLLEETWKKETADIKEVLASKITFINEFAAEVSTLQKEFSEKLKEHRGKISETVVVEEEEKLAGPLDVMPLKLGINSQINMEVRGDTFYIQSTNVESGSDNPIKEQIVLPYSEKAKALVHKLSISLDAAYFDEQGYKNMKHIVEDFGLQAFSQVVVKKDRVLTMDEDRFSRLLEDTIKFPEALTHFNAELADVTLVKDPTLIKIVDYTVRRASNLTHLTLNFRRTEIADASVQYLMKHIQPTRLETFKLYLGGTKVTRKSLKSVFVPFPRMKDFALSIGFSDINDQTFESFIEDCLPSMKLLTNFEMYIGGTNITEPCVKKMMERIPRTVRSLTLVLMQMETQTEAIKYLVEQAINEMTYLKYLDFLVDRQSMSPELESELRSCFTERGELQLRFL